MYPVGYNIEIELYVTSNGKCPFDVWLDKIREVHTRAKILARLDRLKLGNFGDCKSIGDGLSEMRIHYGPGIRVYYSKIGSKIVLLLCGGEKKTQAKDIKKAKEYLADIQKRGKQYGKK